MMLTAAMVTALMMASMAFPAFAGEGGAKVQKYGPCSTGINEPSVGEQCHMVETPSGVTNVHVHEHPKKDGNASGGGAVHEEPLCIHPQQEGGAVTTPSGNTNVHCTGPDQG